MGQELPTALESLPMIAYAEDLPIARRYWRHVFDRRLRVQAAIIIPDLRSALTALTAGAGWSVVPSYLCRTELASGALRLLHQPEDPPDQHCLPRPTPRQFHQSSRHARP